MGSHPFIDYIRTKNKIDTQTDLKNTTDLNIVCTCNLYAVQ